MNLWCVCARRAGIAILAGTAVAAGAGAPARQQPEARQVEPPNPAAVAAADAAQTRERVALLERLLPGAPDRAAALYYLAALHQHLGETRQALALLRECLSYREGFDPTSSPSLAPLKGTKDFDEMVAAVHREFPAVARARLAFTTKQIDLEAEGLAYDAARGVFYLSSQNRRKIVRLTPQRDEEDFVPAGRDNLLPVLGIRVAADGTVWAATWDDGTNRSELLHFVVRPDGSGAVLGRYAPPDAGAHGFNDLVVRASGEVMVTDSVSNQVYRFDPQTHAFATLTTGRTLLEPNGITLAPDERRLFVADDFGIVRVDLASGESRDLLRPPHSTLAVVDGLYWHNDSLLAVQNGIGTPRIAVFHLAADATRVDRITVLENRTPFTQSPTTGAIAGGQFYFIANSEPREAVRIGVLELP
jgi:DNA-binding beta-propeller fold protein YncE